VILVAVVILVVIVVDALPLEPLAWIVEICFGRFSQTWLSIFI